MTYKRHCIINHMQFDTFVRLKMTIIPKLPTTGSVVIGGFPAQKFSKEDKISV